MKKYTSEEAQAILNQIINIGVDIVMVSDPEGDDKVLRTRVEMLAVMLSPSFDYMRCDVNFKGLDTDAKNGLIDALENYYNAIVETGEIKYREYKAGK